jgi:hypothetical protein
LKTMLFALMILILMTSIATVACSSYSPPPATTSPATVSGNSTAQSSQIAPAAGPRLEVIYFHMTQRCVTCLCFEERINYVMATYFKDDISAGRIDYRVLNAQDPNNLLMAKKYGVVSSQLSLNTISGGVERIKNLDAIWDWNCRGDKNGFDQKVRTAIIQSFNGDN